MLNPDAAEPDEEPEIKKLEFLEDSELPLGIGDDETSEPEGEPGAFLRRRKLEMQTKLKPEHVLFSCPRCRSETETAQKKIFLCEKINV